MSTETISNPGFVVNCTTCKGLYNTPADTKEEARNLANIHLSSAHEGHKSHAGHVVAIVPATLVRRG